MTEIEFQQLQPNVSIVNYANYQYRVAEKKNLFGANFVGIYDEFPLNEHINFIKAESCVYVPIKMRIWICVYDYADMVIYNDLINKIYNIESFKQCPIFVIDHSDTNRFFTKNHLHDSLNLTNKVEEMVWEMPHELKHFPNGWRRFMAFRSYPSMEIHSITFSIT